MQQSNSKICIYALQNRTDRRTTRNEVRAVIEQKIGDFGEDDANLVQFLAQLIYYLPKKTVTNFFTQLDSISGVNRSGQKTMKQPLLKYVYNKHLSTVRNMQNDPYFATLLYVLRKELELGQKKGSVICRMLFRDNSISRSLCHICLLHTEIFFVLI